MKNQANVVRKQSIIPELVSGSSTHAVTKLQALKTLKKFQGLSYFIVTRSLALCRHAEFISASSRYDNNKTLKQVQGDGRRGFTLIELLVVVLIIGILAAVAVPQYRMAVAKSRFANTKILVDNVVRAEESYYLANGSYTNDFEKLDIGLPAGETEDSFISNKEGTDSKYFYSWGHCQTSFTRVCCISSDNVGYCRGFLRNTSSTAGRRCVVWDTTDPSDWRNQICKAETGAKKGTVVNNARLSWEYKNE